MRSNLLSEYSLSLSEIATLVGTSDANLESNNLSITGITLDSNDVIQGDLFVALPGANSHGSKFIDSAVANGAIAVLTDMSANVHADIPVLRVNDPRLWVGVIADKFYRNPSSAINVFGITGTNGKTTTFMSGIICLTCAANLVTASTTSGTTMHVSPLSWVQITTPAPPFNAFIAKS